MSSPAKPVRILVVDDDLGLTRLVERTLKREGFGVTAASSGREALAWLKDQSADLMLLDLKLQDTDGKQLIQTLAATGPVPPFVIITGQGDERVAVDMMKRGALDYLVKDAQFIEFVPLVVRRALEKLETNRQLAEAQAALDESRKQVLTISEREQRRIGAELHDGLGQQLTAIELLCQSLNEDLPANRSDLRKQVAQISGFLRDTVTQARAMARGLTPVQLGSGGLTEALEELAANMSRAGRIRCEYIAGETVVVKDPEVAGHLFRIAQEAVNNAVKHAHPSRITLQLRAVADDLELVIADDGSGLPPAGPGKGMGLQMMKHRADLIGGKLVIDSAKKGLTIRCIVRLPIQ